MVRQDPSYFLAGTGNQTSTGRTDEPPPLWRRPQLGQHELGPDGWNLNKETKRQTKRMRMVPEKAKEVQAHDK